MKGKDFMTLWGEALVLEKQIFVGFVYGFTTHMYDGRAKRF
jgi:hypothetical protein